ncbi:MAG: histidine phosphatase family protein [Deltaproteobacteria bacterium]|nr:histidine phosphatase family protein [Deltaproteobacteria bacterium]
MSNLRHVVLVRHGETEGNSSTRFHGANDVGLADTGRAQMRGVRFALHRDVFDQVCASPLQRSWEAARIVSGGAPVQLLAGLREIDFGRWEGLTQTEIEAADPVLYRDWQNDRANFDFPGGEVRSEFRARVERAFDGIAASGVASVLIVVHKGTIRAIAQKLLAEALPEGEPGLGEVMVVSCGADGKWFRGRHGSDAPAPEEQAA